MILETTAVIDTSQDTEFTLWTAGSGQVKSLISNIWKEGALCVCVYCFFCTLAIYRCNFKENCSTLHLAVFSTKQDSAREID